MGPWARGPWALGCLEVTGMIRCLGKGVYSIEGCACNRGKADLPTLLQFFVEAFVNMRMLCVLNLPSAALMLHQMSVTTAQFDLFVPISGTSSPVAAPASSSFPSDIPSDLPSDVPSDTPSDTPSTLPTIQITTLTPVQLSTDSPTSRDRTNTPTKEPSLPPTSLPTTTKPTTVPVITVTPSGLPRETTQRPSYSSASSCSREEAALVACFSDQMDTNATSACRSCVTASVPSSINSCDELQTTMCSAIDTCQCAACAKAIETLLDCSFFLAPVNCRIYCS